LSRASRLGEQRVPYRDGRDEPGHDEKCEPGHDENIEAPAMTRHR
jgi:hypothetical protein